MFRRATFYNLAEAGHYRSVVVSGFSRTTAIMSEQPKEVPRPLDPNTKCERKDDQVTCERCGGEMYRMHAVWRCSSCGFKTDCCGW
jgi:hypothetical protein